eukprot:GHVQ01040666.1.p1 GENE.GHVQ01040666.1~~GHVQ01040666.1.p1  ORF type:complete len:676 (-),score=93.27 GHVQ01040666.1:347-2374(-)
MSSKMLQVKNKTPAPIQITAEQLLREAVERQSDEVRAPLQRIVDSDELQQYRVRKRKEYEDTLRRQTHHIGTWIKYAQWEGEQKEFRRSRSIFERALNVDYQNVGIWVKYIEMETHNKFINSARNLYDRVCRLLPRVDQFWFKYAHMEELLGNYAGARSIFERWMEWLPDDKAWMLYIKYEERCGELPRARAVFEQYLSHCPSQLSFLRFAKFEERHRNFNRARAGYEKAIEVLPMDSLDEQFFIKFAEFEARHKQNERSKVVYQQALARLPKGKSDMLYTKYVAFQKQHGAREDIEDTVMTKRRFFYEDEVKDSPLNYDVWFDYIKLEEAVGRIDAIRDLYERSVANVPPTTQDKRYWKRYIYLWINYALFEEVVADNIARCREVYEMALSIIPKKLFTFAKLYILYSEFEVRQLQMDRARKILGRAIAECGKAKIFTSYASLEVRLGNLDRCRTIYAKQIEMTPRSAKAWTSLIEVELLAEEVERATGICELAVGMEEMDQPELVWKAYLDCETNYGTPEGARQLYERLLTKTQHYKVFQGYAEFEFRHAENIDKARDVVQRGLDVTKDRELDEERSILLEYWLEIEKEHGEPKKVEAVLKKQPKKVKRRKEVVDEDGEALGFEDYMAYVFPEDGPISMNMKILERAKQWKKQAAAAPASEPPRPEGDDDDSS